MDSSTTSQPAPVHGERSHRLVTPEVDLAVTARGGHLAPAIFHLPGREVSPYSLSPWEPGEFSDQPALLSVLRGDFFCLPFGPQADGPPHGAPANHEWAVVSKSERTLHLALDAADSGARLEKIVSVKAGHHAIYYEHRISGLEGDFSYGNHPILDLSGLPESAGRVSTSAIRWGSVYPGVFSDPARGETQALLGSAAFSDLREVPLAAGGTTDLSRYPARAGCEDLVMLVNEAATADQPFAWSAVVMDGFVWFGLKNPADFPATLFWLSNGGRSGPPWNSRHRGRIGIEEVCSYFCDSVDVSREDRLAHLGVPTTRQFRPEETTSLRIVQAVAPVLPGFGRVAAIAPAGESTVAVEDESGARIHVPVDWRHVA